MLDECLDEDTSLGLAVESGPCGARADVQRTAAIGGTFDLLPPGSYCVDAIAFHRDDEARRCRVLGLDRENRRLPDDRAPIALEVGCEAVDTELGDDLLAAVAGCNGRCDIDRCVCSRGCDLSDPDARCLHPVQVEQVVIGDHYACGIAEDHRSAWCWGDELLAEFTDGSTGPAGVARRVFPLEQPTDEYVLFDGSPGAICVQTAEGMVRCTGEAPRPDARPRRSLSAVGEGFLCRGDMGVIGCYVFATSEGKALPYAFPSDLSAGRTTVCELVAGEVYCAAPAVPCDDEETCWWGPERCRVMRDCVALVPVDDPAHPIELGFIDIDLGWDRGCAVDNGGRLSCWSERGADPVGLPTPSLVPDRTPRAVNAALIELPDPSDVREVSVGSEHVCVRRYDGVECGVIEATSSGFSLARRERFPGDGAIGSFAAGPHGITCAVRVVEGTDRRVECFQLAGFGGGQELLGRAHARDREPGVTDMDHADLAVCP